MLERMIGRCVGAGLLGRASAVALGLAASCGVAGAQPFSYQGFLSDAGQPADGAYDVRITLLDGGGATVAGPILFNNVAVDAGVFSVDLNFGPGVFNGEARMLALAFRAGSSSGSYTELLPHTPINPAPYALYALDAFSEVTRDGSTVRIGEGDGEQVAVINPAMSGGAVVNQFTNLQVNFDADGSYGGVYVNGRTIDDLPFYGFANGGQGYAFIDYMRTLDEMRVWVFGSFVPVMRFGADEVVSGTSFVVEGDLSIGTGGVIRPETGSQVDVVGSLYASNELRSELDVVVGDDLEVNDQIMKNYGTGQFYPAVPIAFGSFQSSGSKLAGTSNITAVWDPSFMRYLVDITGFNASLDPEVVSVTPRGSTPLVATMGTAGGDVLVYLYSLGGSRVQGSFDIVVYDARNLVTRQPAE